MDHVKKLLALALLLPALAWSASGNFLYEKTNIPPGVIKVFDGADKTGVTDVTAKMITFFQQGGYLFIPDGDYLIANAGPAAGGVYAELTKSIHVECGPKAVLHGTNLDHDIVRFTVPSTGVGLPSGGISVIWHGCTFDQTTQKTSTSVPFSGTYTSTNQGTSGNTDGLDISGEYVVSTVYYAGINYAEVSGATFNAGTHWQNAGSGSGGDSGSGCQGVILCVYHGNRFFGNRDASIYVSNSTGGTLTKIRADVYGNYFENSFGCVAIKRSTLGFSIHDNQCIGAVSGFGVSQLVGNGTSEGAIYNNRCSGCQVNERVDYGTNISIHDEKCDNFGAFLADGVTVPATYTPTGIWLLGVRKSIIRDNSCTSISATYAALSPKYITLADYSAIGPTASTGNIVEHNMSDGFYMAGTESGSADYNEFYENYEWSGTFPYFNVTGTHSSQSYMDRTTGIRYHRNPQAFIDGSAAAPEIARLADVTSGMYFGTGTVNFAIGGTEKARINSAGVNASGLVLSTLGATALTIGSLTPIDQVFGNGPTGSTRLTARFTADATGTQDFFLKSRNATPGSHTTITTGDCLGKSFFYGDDGTNYDALAGEVDFCSTGTISTGVIPGTYGLKLANASGSMITVLSATSAGVSSALPYVSTLATGTAPFTVASTTNVANLNASSLSGATFSAPGAIGGGTPAAGTFTTLNASGLVTPSTTVGIKGTAAADAAQAGSIGEVFSIHCLMGAAAAAGSAVSLPVASPGVVTWSSHTFTVSSPAPANYSCPINFSANGGTLPTGLVAGTTYYIIGSTVSGDTFQVADTMAHALAGTNAINFTGSPAGSPLGWLGYLIATTNTVGGAGLSVTAGDWDCSGVAEWQELTNLTITEYLQGINTSVAIPTIGDYLDVRYASSAIGAASYSMVTPQVRENVSSTTLLYLVEKATFSVGTQNAGGRLYCRRMR